MRLGVLGGTALTLCLVATVALGAETNTEREEYVAKAEPICKANVLANKRIFKGTRAEVRAGKLKLASRHFFRAARAFAKTIRELAAVPQPPTDAAKLTKWLGLLQTGKGIVEKIGRALAKENRHRAESLTVDLTRNSIEANNTVLPFGFRYCRIEPSRFG